MMSDSTKQRKGQNGKFSKNRKYISNDGKRKIKEDTKLKQLNRLINEIATLTKTPIALLALNSSGGVVISGTTNKMFEEFLKDKDVLEKFERCAKADADPVFSSNTLNNLLQENDIAEVNEEESTVKRRKLEKEFELPVDWEKMNALRKRDLARNLVLWDSGIENFEWIPENRPSWWPRDVNFQSTRKASVATLDMIFKSFIKGQAFSVMNMSFSTDDFENWETFSDWVVENRPDLDLPIDWVKNNWEKPDYQLDSDFVSLKYRSLLENTCMEPLRFGTLSECISFSLFRDSRYYSFIKHCSFIVCSENETKLMECVKDGLGDIPSETIQGWLGVSEDDSFRSSLIKSYNESGIFDIFGAALAFNMKINLHTEDRRMALHFDESYIGEIDILFLEPTGECCSLVNASDFGRTCSDHNVYCRAVTPSAPSMTCADCLLNYHVFCAEKHNTCGCSDITQLSARIKRSILSHENLTQILEARPPITSFIRGILSGIYPSCRSRTIGKLLNEDTKLNIFFIKMLSDESRIFCIEYTKKSIDENARNIINNRFPDGSFDEVVSKWLMPDMIIDTIKTFMGRNMMYTNLMVERALFNGNQYLYWRG